MGKTLSEGDADLLRELKRKAFAEGRSEQIAAANPMRALARKQALTLQYSHLLVMEHERGRQAAMMAGFHAVDSSLDSLRTEAFNEGWASQVRAASTPALGIVAANIRDSISAALARIVTPQRATRLSEIEDLEDMLAKIERVLDEYLAPAPVSLSDRIVWRAVELRASNIPARNRATRIAADCGCSARHVRNVLKERKAEL